MQTKKQILLAYGGQSSEHDVSMISARNVHDALDTSKYQIYLAYIDHDGIWHYVKSLDDMAGEVITPMLGERMFRTESDHKLAIDVMFPILHGQFGEDGTVQGMAKLLHIPCVGPGLIGAAMTMDKDITKRLLRDGGVPVVDWSVWHTYEAWPTYEDATRSLMSYELFVKPANAGSSVGVSKVTNAREFNQALSAAAEHDSIILIEPAVQAREIELAVLGTAHPQVSTPGEIIPGAEFYSYDDKYASDSRATSQIPALLDDATVRQLQAYALHAYQLTRGQGMARIDFFVTDDDQIYLNEINAIPGFTNISMYPKMWQHDGLEYAALIDRLVEDALAQSPLFSALKKTEEPCAVAVAVPDRARAL